MAPLRLSVVERAFNPSTQRSEAGRLLSLRLALDYKMSSPSRQGYTENPVLWRGRGLLLSEQCEHN